MGAVYNPLMNEFFFAEKGKGAILNDQQIHVSKKTKVLESCMVTGFPYTYLDNEKWAVASFFTIGETRNSRAKIGQCGHRFVLGRCRTI